jgi:hypothetical protein
MINNITKEEIERRKTASDRKNLTDDLTFGKIGKDSDKGKFYKKVREYKDDNEIKKLIKLDYDDYFNHLLD